MHLFFHSCNRKGKVKNGSRKGVRENYTGRGRNLKQTGKKCVEELMHETTQMHGFMAARLGKVFAECWWAPF